MYTNPKSGDYLAWFFCTKEQTRGQVAHFCRQGCLFDHQLLAAPEDIVAVPEDRHTVSPYTVVVDTSRNQRQDDIVERIKRARARTDRTLAVLRREAERHSDKGQTVRNPLETFISGFAHHFNNLFMAIQGNVSLILSTRRVKHRHRRRLKRIEKLVLSESMLTNDLLGIVVEKGCHVDQKLQAHLLDEIVAISDTLIMRQAFCAWDDTSSRRTKIPSKALQRLASGLSGIVHRLLNEIEEHTAYIIADESTDGLENARLSRIIKTVRSGRQMLIDLTGQANPVDSRPVDPVTLAEIVMDTCLQGRKGTRCHVDITPDLAAVRIGKSQMDRILRELCNNAAAAMPRGGDIFVTVEKHRQKSRDRRGEWIRMTVRDTGVGMTPEVSERVFDPFYRGPASHEGAGLGLTAVAAHLRAIGGRISVASTPGNGSVFTLDLPAVGAEVVKWSPRFTEETAPIKRPA